MRIQTGGQRASEEERHPGREPPVCTSWQHVSHAWFFQEGKLFTQPDCRWLSCTHPPDARQARPSCRNAPGRARVATCPTYWWDVISYLVETESRLRCDCAPQQSALTPPPSFPPHFPTPSAALPGLTPTQTRLPRPFTVADAKQKPWQAGRGSCLPDPSFSGRQGQAGRLGCSAGRRPFILQPHQFPPPLRRRKEKSSPGRQAGGRAGAAAQPGPARAQATLPHRSVT